MSKSREKIDFTAFKRNLQYFLDLRQLSLYKFSQDIDLPYATVYRYLYDERTPDLEYVIKIAKYFNVSIDWMLGLSPDPVDTVPEDTKDFALKYTVATESDKDVIRAVLKKYESKENQS